MSWLRRCNRGQEIAHNKLSTRVKELEDELQQYWEVIYDGKRLPAPELKQDPAFAAYVIGKLEKDNIQLLNKVYPPVYGVDPKYTFLCTCMGRKIPGGGVTHSVGCFDDKGNHCPKCNSYMYYPDGKTKKDYCPDSFNKGCKWKYLS